MINGLLIACAGFLGAVSRYLLSLWFEKLGNKFTLYGTTIINIIGSFMLGVTYGLFLNGDILDKWYTILSIGFFGAFTTFSTFSYEAYNLYSSSKRKGVLFMLISILRAALCTGLAIILVS